MVRNDKNFFKTYDNKSSLLKRNTRLLQGGTTDIKTNRLGFWDRDISKFSGDVSDIVIEKLDAKYSERPDLLAYDLYGRANLAWAILLYNNIVDISDFKAGITIIAPSEGYVFSKIITETIRTRDVRST